jgi:hypothetical protein
MAKNYRTELLDMVDQGILVNESLIRNLVNWLSESEMQEFMEANEYVEEDEEEEDYEEEE